MQSITSNFPITENEYKELDDEFGKLCYYASWQLDKKNSKNNHTNDPEDTVQQLRIALMRAGSYHKRQTYILSCFKVLEKHIEDRFIYNMLEQLVYLWKNKTRHGANRQKFGAFQEQIVKKLIKIYVPKDEAPDHEASLVIDSVFARYCKQIVWNEQKLLGKKITREKSWRTGLVSLSEFEYLGVV